MCVATFCVTDSVSLIHIPRASSFLSHFLPPSYLHLPHGISILPSQAMRSASMYKSKFQDCIQEKNLHAFYAHDDPRLDAAAEVAAAHIDQVCAVWKIPVEKGQVLAKLALFDVVLYIDNSGSMRQYEDDGRIEELRSVVALVVDIVRLFDSDGFGVRYMNGKCLILRSTKSLYALLLLHRLMKPVLSSSTNPTVMLYPVC